MGTLQVNSLAVSNAAGSVFTPGTLTSTVQFNAANTLPATVFTTFNRVTFATGTTTASTGLTITGNVIINAAGGFSAGNFTHSVGGNWTNNGGTFLPSTGTINFNSTAANQVILGTAATQTFNNLTNTNTGRTLAIGGSTTTLNITGALAVTSGTFNIGAITTTVTGATTISGTLGITSAVNTKIFTGLITVNTGGTWSNTANAPITVRGGITNNGTFTAGTGIYTFDINNQDLNGILSISRVTVNVITLNNNNTLTVGTALAGSGVLNQVANALLKIGGTAAISTLQATSSGNTVNYTGAAQTLNSTNYYHLTMSGSGTDVMQAGTTSIGGDLTISGTVRTSIAANLTVGGNLVVGDGTIFTVGAFTFGVTGTTTIGAGVSGSIIISSATGAKSFTGLIRVNTGGSWNNSGGASLSVENGITNSGTFTGAATGIYTFNTNSQALNGSPTITMGNVVVPSGITVTNNNLCTIPTSLTGAGTFVQAAGATLSLGGTSTITSLQATNSGNTVNYTGAGQTVYSTNYANLTLSGSGTAVMQAGTTSITGNFTFGGTVRTTAVKALTIGGNLVIGAAANTFTAGAFTHSLAGNFTNNGTFTAAGSTLLLNGSTTQTIGGSRATTFASLTLSNAAGVTLVDGVNNVNKTITTNINLAAGYLTTSSTNLLILNNNATATVANSVAGVPQYNSPYVNGPMNKVGNQAFIFPVGSLGTGCVPIGISAPTLATDAFQGQYNRIPANSLGPLSAGMATIVAYVNVCEHWILNRVNGTPTVNVTGYWNANSPCNGETPGNYVKDLVTIALVHFNGTQWDASSYGSSFTNGGTITGSITWTGVSTFSPFALGNNFGTPDNPLAIKLDYFTAVKGNGFNTLSWKAQCNAAPNTFELQRSDNGIDFTRIDSATAVNPADCSQGFSYNDYGSTSAKSYYRVKMTDSHGVESYSVIKLITAETPALELISLAPNPVHESTSLTINATKAATVELVILGMEGKPLQRRSVQVQPGTNTVSLQTGSLSKGVYILQGTFLGGQTQIIKFLRN